MYMVCFVFKQKTACEFVSSDWSSDVCSSDLHDRVRQPRDPALADPVLLEELLHLRADGGGRVGLGEVGERAALDEARHLVVVVGEHEVGRVPADEARGDDIRTRDRMSTRLTSSH